MDLLLPPAALCASVSMLSTAGAQAVNNKMASVIKKLLITTPYVL
jgi:hypothetical protein